MYGDVNGKKMHTNLTYWSLAMRAIPSKLAMHPSHQVRTVQQSIKIMIQTAHHPC